MLVSVEEVREYLEDYITKKHLNIDSSFMEDDEYLSHLEYVAEELVQKHIDKTFEKIVEDEGSIPYSLVHAILLFVGNLYENREPNAYTTINEIPLGLRSILQLYRDYSNANI